MSITKTPEQIAAEIVNDNTAPDEWSPVLMSEVAALVAAGIEADRAQRPNAHAVMDDLLSAWEAYDGDVSGFYDAWAEHLNNGTPVPDWARA